MYRILVLHSAWHVVLFFSVDHFLLVILDFCFLSHFFSLDPVRQTSLGDSPAGRGWPVPRVHSPRAPDYHVFVLSASLSSGVFPLVFFFHVAGPQSIIPTRSIAMVI
jgi:hypothetical protein